MGEVVPSPALGIEEVPDGYSSKHQWLPCEVSLDDSGNAAITSYINNLDPTAHGPLYTAIEQVITKSVPMWKLALQSTLVQYDHPRIELQGDGYDHDTAEADHQAMRQQRKDDRQRKKNERRENRAVEYTREEDGKKDLNVDSGEEEDEDESDGDGSDYDDYCDPYQDQYIQLPEPAAYETRNRKSTEEEASKFAQTIASKKLQVIVKLANVHLTPEKPSYDGGSWHIEVRSFAAHGHK